jgi:aminoglycoside 3-N-acetyltransferase
MNRDYEILKDDLRAIGLTAADSVLIHSSFKSMGYVEGGIETVVSAILSVIGDNGTLIAPTLTFRDVSEENPVFDYLHTPSCVGAISEYVRNANGAIRSIHPTHSCASLGKYAAEYAKDHEKDNTPIGINSPFRKLPEYGGKILMLGCGAAPNTSMHGVEEKMNVPYVLPKEPKPYTVILPDKTYTIPFYRHHIRQNGYAQHYARLADLMDGEGMRCGMIHGAQSILFDASAVWKTGEKALRENPYYFVDYVG